MAHNAKDVANEIIRRGAETHRIFTHLQVQKLVYYCHAWMLGIHGKPLINQSIAAWQHGPVIEDLYHTLKKHGRNQVQIIPSVRPERYAAEETGLIDQVLHLYGGLSGVELSSSTHSAGSPWDQTVQEGYTRNLVIPNDLIQSYYGKVYQDHLKEQQETVAS